MKFKKVILATIGSCQDDLLFWFDIVQALVDRVELGLQPVLLLL
ncbi:MAG: hypothetical protein PHT43_05865 [Anaerolineaceae bacterium]|nr:hypothetical protein [Anaerolineaceae bacterium]